MAPKTPRGATFLVVGAIMFVLWFGGTMTNAFLLPASIPEIVREYFPLGMLAFCIASLVTTAGERAVAFTPAEVDFLFPGPFTRRQLLGYKIARSVFAAIFTATLFSLVFLRYSQHWVGGWIAMFLALIFVQLLSMAIVLIGQTVGESAYTRARKLAIVAIIIAVAAIVLPRKLHAQPSSFPEIAHELMHSPSGRILLAPLAPFAKILTADPLLPDVFIWSFVAIGLIGILLTIVMQLDTHYLESAAKTGQQVYERQSRFRRGGGVAFRATTARSRIPMLPRFAGAGAVAWRQILTALRTARAMLLVLVFVCIAVGPVLYMGHAEKNIQNILVGILFWITFMLANMLRFDFRGDLDHIDTLKSLPVSPSAIAIAQLVAPVMVLSICQIVLMVSIGVMLHMAALKILLIADLRATAERDADRDRESDLPDLPRACDRGQPRRFAGLRPANAGIPAQSDHPRSPRRCIAMAIGAGVWWIANYLTAAFLATTFVVMIAELSPRSRCWSSPSASSIQASTLLLEAKSSTFRALISHLVTLSAPRLLIGWGILPPCDPTADPTTRFDRSTSPAASPPRRRGRCCGSRAGRLCW